MTSPVALPGRLGQATAVESSRAVAEVYASVMAAKNDPRDTDKAIDAMRQSCQMPKLAERAFYRYNRGDGQVNGATIQLAAELARCWRNMAYGVHEMRRDDDYGQSEMLAYAWDLESNVRRTAVFIVPHGRDKDGGIKKLTALRDIYENNANNGARRVRECIFGLLPVWFRSEAEDLCHKTLSDGGGVPRDQRIANLIQHFATIGVRRGDLIRKLDDQPPNRWDDQDIANMRIVFESIKRGETTRDIEFPRPVVTPEELAGPSTPEGTTP